VTPSNSRTDNLRPLPDTLTVVAWRDAVVETHGHLPRSPYIDACYTAVLGCTSVACFRRISTLASITHDGIDIDTADLAACLGLSTSTSRNSRLAHTLGRLADFHAAKWTDQGHYAVRLALATLPERVAQRLPKSARLYHEHTLDARRLGTGRAETPSAGEERHVGRDEPSSGRGLAVPTQLTRAVNTVTRGR
jgi:hypothetical protein